MMFRILMGIDIAAAAIVGYFFVVGLVDGSIPLSHADLWVGLLLAIAAIVAAGFTLRRSGRTFVASLLLAFLAGPVLIYGGFVLFALLSGGR